MSERILVFVATYNEAANIKQLIIAIKQSLADCHILICDDKSPDGTSELVKTLQEQLQDLHLMTRPGKMGLGTAHQLGMSYAVDHDYDLLITMDADFSHDPKYLPEIVAKSADYDFVIGSRYVKGGYCAYKWQRRVLSRTANGLTRMLLNIPLAETTTAYRAYKTELLKRMPFEQINSTGYAFFFESLYLVCKYTKQLAEVPIYFADRREGQSKLSKREIGLAMLRLAVLAWQQLTLRHSALVPQRKPRISANKSDLPKI